MGREWVMFLFVIGGKGFLRGWGGLGIEFYFI